MSEQKQQKLPSWTELAIIVKQLGDAVLEHTEARTYLYKAATGEIPLPNIAVNNQCDQSDGEQKTECKVAFDLQTLPTDTVEMMLLAMIQHEEKMTFSLWGQLSGVVNQAGLLV